MRIQWVSGLHLIFLSIFLVAIAYTCLGAQNLTVGCHEQERLALLEFKHSVKDDFKMLSSWIGIDCCSWKGVLCDAATGSVTGLQLRGNHDGKKNYYLEGEKVNAYLAELRHLKYLDLSGNNFEGSQIPEFIGSFKQLNCLNLSHANFYDIIPHHIGNLSNLKVLDLSSSPFLLSNDMSWVSGLSSLEHLDLSEVGLYQAKNIDMVLYMLPSLTYLNLRFCGLSNTDLGNHLNSSKILPNLEHLDLNFNNFEGQLPPFIQNMTSLTFLDLSFYNLSLAWNSLTLLNMISSLSELHLSRCGLHNTHFSPTNFNISVHSKIQYLDLSGNSMEGIFPYELVNMTSLRVLDLSRNSLNSSIPVIPNLQVLDVSDNNFENIELVGIWRQCHLKELSLSGSYFGKEMIDVSKNIYECSQYALEMLDLEQSHLNGAIPESLRRLTNLRVLNLRENNLIGSIPKALSRLRSLEVLDLSNNDLTGPILTFLGKLTILDLSENQFSGPIPKSIGRLISLTEFNLQSNRLTGPIPKSIGRLTSLTKFDLQSNQLTGSIPKSIGRLTSLTVLYLQSNQLTGSIPKSIGRLTSLTVLHLQSNQLTGPIPKSIGRLTSLTDLNLQSNRLTGPIPKSIGRLTSLSDLKLRSNQLTGPIPTSLGSLASLGLLDVSNNSLEGMLSETHFAKLSTLKYLNTTDNKLIFNISHEWIPPFQLIGFWIGFCKIANGFPQWLQTQRELEELDLHNTSLHGIPPTWFRNMPINVYLDLSHNKFTGDLGNLPYSKSLLLQDNLFNGSIPRSLCRGTHLSYLDVSRNKLSGNIPGCVWNLQQMQVLILSSNGLSGIIPGSLRNIYSPLSWLKLDDNNFHGELPTDLWKWRYLSVLDLGNNKFSGNIPKGIGENLTFLMVLKLHKNNFTGRIPQSLCKCSYLQILDVAHNNLTGPIPRCFRELTGMIEVGQHNIREVYNSDENVIQVMKGMNLQYTKTLTLVFNMDLSSNKLIGEIPQEITALTMLMGLNLSHNHLNGSIPERIGEMKALFSLDFSDNELTGRIPPSMAALNFLSSLNLSYNNLSGQIPTGNQLQTLNDPSIYVGNRDLCGAPLPSNCSNHENPPTISKNKNEDTDEPKNLWFYLDITFGFATGFWGIIGVLSFKKQWRHKLFMIAEVTIDKVCLQVALRVSKIKKGRKTK